MPAAVLRLGIDSPASGPALLAERPRRAPVSAAEVRPLSEAPGAVRAALLSGARATAALPFGAALLVPIEAPPLPPSKLRRVLPSLLATSLPFPLSDCVHAFERTADGRLLAHVVRRADLDARLAELRVQGCDPAWIVPPGPALWRAAWGRSAPAGASAAPRAVFFAAPDRTLLVTGRGACPEAVSVFRTGSPDEPLRRLRLAFGGIPDALEVFVAGPSHAVVSSALPGPLKVAVPSAPEAFLARALSAPDLADLNLRLGPSAHRATGRSSVPLRAAAIAFVLCSAFAAFAAGTERLLAERARAAAEAGWTKAVESLAGGPVPGLRGADALAYARAEAKAQTLPPDLPSDASAEFLRAARAAGVRLDGFELSPAGVLAEGTAPSRDAARAFADALRGAGLSCTVVDRPERDGRPGFSLQPDSAP